MTKRTERDDDPLDALHPSKLSRRVSELRLAPPDPDELAPAGLPPDPQDNDMDGVEARDFVFLTSRDVRDALNAVEIDDRFMKIPRAVISADKDVPYFERPTQALIPFRPDPCADPNVDAMCDSD